jgi:hypothetical protein
MMLSILLIVLSFWLIGSTLIVLLCVRSGDRKVHQRRDQPRRRLSKES